ncbi:cytochrome P450 [Fomes fomentarius]|nr:cytochrome P450 [Fomes fomentarius]
MFAMDDYHALLYTSLVSLVVVYILRWRLNPLNSIPTVGGSSLPLLSYWTNRNFERDPFEHLREGHRKYRGAPFKIALQGEWGVVLSDPKMIDDLRRRPEDELSFSAHVEEDFQIPRTLGAEFHTDPYHIGVIRNQLTRALPLVLPEIIDELDVAMPTYLPLKGDEWVTVTMVSTLQKVVARISSRVFVGLPLCRNRDYLDIVVNFAIDMISDRNRFMGYPQFLRSLIARLKSDTGRNVGKASQYLSPIFDERRVMLEAFGEGYSGKPKDLLQWILEEGIRRGSSDQAMATRILLTYFGAVDATSITLTHALFDLASMPRYIQPLRKEIESVIATDGWTKLSMDKMWKLDSFLKESQRYNGANFVTMLRKTLKDVRMSDGTIIPAGTTVGAASYLIHHDSASYPSPDIFDPFRFATLRESEGEGAKHQFVNTSMNHLTFGHGKHACPGRFFAANELKALLCYILINYDFKLVGDKRPENRILGYHSLPNPSGEMMFRRRQAVA